jgi:hypothetical protein
VRLDDTTALGSFRLAKVVGGKGRGEPESFVLPGMVGPCGGSGGRGGGRWPPPPPDATSCITIDFSPKGGPRDFTGWWDNDGIKFPDGNKWPRTGPASN